MALTSRTRRKLLRRRREAVNHYRDIGEVEPSEDYYDHYDAEYDLEDDDYDPDRPAVHGSYEEDEWIPYRVDDVYRLEREQEDAHFRKLHHHGAHQDSVRRRSHRSSRSNYSRNSPGGHSSRITGSSMRRRKSQF